MPRKPDVWRRKYPDGKLGPWYSWIAGKRTWLAPATATLKEARDEQARARLARPQSERKHGNDFSVGDVLQLYAQNCMRETKNGERVKGSFETIKFRCQAMGKKLGAIRATDLREHHVDAAIDRIKEWKSTATRVGGKHVLRSAFRWAKRVGHISENPIESLKVGTMPRRENIITAEQGTAVLAELRGSAVHDVIYALWKTGCRPGEAYNMTADDVDFTRKTWSVLDKIRRKTGVSRRIIPVSDDVLTLCRRLAEKHPKGFLFRGGRGNAWTSASVHHRLKTVSEKLKIGRHVRAYEFRHLWATEAIAGGASVALVAQILGHKDWHMLAKHYAHLDGCLPELHAVVASVRPPDQNRESEE